MDVIDSNHVLAVASPQKTIQLRKVWEIIKSK